MLDWAPPAAVFLRLALDSAAAGRGLRPELPAALEPAGLARGSVALRPTMEEDCEARNRRSAAASSSSLFGADKAVREEEEVLRPKGLREEKVERAPAPNAEAMLVGREDA